MEAGARRRRRFLAMFVVAVALAGACTYSVADLQHVAEGADSSVESGPPSDSDGDTYSDGAGDERGDTGPAVILPQATCIATGIGQPWGIAVDDAHVYFTNHAPGGTIGRVAKNSDGGGALVDVAQSSGFGGTLAVVVDDAGINWTEPSSGLLRFTNKALVGQPRGFYSSVSGVGEFVLDDARVYVVVRGGDDVYTVTRDAGGNVEEAFLQAPVGGLAVHGGVVYVAVDSVDSGTPKVVSISTFGTAQTVSLEPGNPGAIVTDDASVYWLADGYLRTIAIGGSDAATLYSGAPTDAGIGASHLAVDDTHIYFTDGVGLHRIAKSFGATAEPLALGANFTGVAIDETRVYWADWSNGGRVCWVAK
jgi:hypothetical protein